MDEVPLPERPLLALDDQEGLAREHEKVLLVRLPVVHPDRLAVPEHVEAHAELRKVRLTVERKRLAPRPAIAPARLLRVEDEPA